MDALNIPLFQQLQPARFSWAVKVPVPADGKYQHFEFVGVFVHMGPEAFNELMKSDKTDLQIAREVMPAVELVDGAGEAVESTPELVEQLLTKSRVALAVVATYSAVMRGAAAQKN